MATGQGRELDISIDVSDLRGIVDVVKGFSPRLARELRRDLRGSGDEVIGKQRAILSGPLPKGVQVTGKRLKVVRNRPGAKSRVRAVNAYGDKEVKRPGRGRGLRERIKAGLKTRVVTGTTRQGINLRTSGPRDGGYNMSKVWQRKRFRHPVFADSANATSAEQAWVYQQGQPYFWDPAYEGFEGMRQNVDQALDKAIAAMANGSS